MKLLFICTNNRDRSKTAEDMYKDVSSTVEIKSAGVALSATQVVDKDLVNWADVIIVMNDKDEQQEFKLHQRFPFLKPMGKKIIDFDIPNKYTRGDPELIKLIKEKMKEKFPDLNI